MGTISHSGHAFRGEIHRSAARFPTVQDFWRKRYGEVLLVRVGDNGPEATVYNTFPLNDCPAELWSRLDAEAIAREHGAAAALLNGPRYWLMDTVEKDMTGRREVVTFGGVDMLRQATVALTSDRFHAGEIIKEAALVVGGKGGGRPDMAQAGGSQPDALPDALASVYALVETATA